MAFIPEITTRVSTKVNADGIDDIINKIQSDPFLSQCPSIVESLQSTKKQLVDIEQPVSYAVAERLQSNQEIIISTKHYITGMMANSVDISQDGNDYLVGNTAMSVDGFPYPLAIETGRREVFPVEKKVLRWFSGGSVVFSKHSSAVGPDPFVEPSINTTLTDIEEIVNNEVMRVLK